MTFFADLTPHTYVRTASAAVDVGWLDASRPFERLRERGNGQIRVKGPNGTCYAAPALISHYVEIHEYKPPAEFIEAVVNGTPLRE